MQNSDKRHYISVSTDSVVGGGMNLVDESLTLLQSPGGQIHKLPSSDSIDASLDTISLDFGNSIFKGVELMEIMANENLAEMALNIPKRVKRRVTFFNLIIALFSFGFLDS